MTDDRWDDDDDFEVENADHRRQVATLRARIEALLIATYPRWLEPRQIEQALIARRVPRTLRAMMFDPGSGWDFGRGW